jgi:serine protease Do
VRKTLDQLVRDGVVRRGTILGIQLQALTPQIAEQLGVADTRGLLVTRVSQRSEAAAAGLRPGDVLVSFNGIAVEGGSQFLKMLSEARIGSTATLAIIRDGRQLTLRVPVEESVPSRLPRR